MTDALVVGRRLDLAGGDPVCRPLSARAVAVPVGAVRELLEQLLAELELGGGRLARGRGLTRLGGVRAAAGRDGERGEPECDQPPHWRTPTRRSP